jgi:hypothetical protein
LNVVLPNPASIQAHLEDKFDAYACKITVEKEENSTDSFTPQYIYEETIETFELDLCLDFGSLHEIDDILMKNLHEKKTGF